MKFFPQENLESLWDGEAAGAPLGPDLQVIQLCLETEEHMDGTPKIVGEIPPNHPMFNRIFHETNHPFWDTTIFWKHLYVLTYLLLCNERNERCS